MEPRFSVIIPVHNARATLPQTVRSIAVQPGPVDWECLLVDNGSTDGSPALCEQLAAEYPWIRNFTTRNEGPGAGRNVGIEAARGEWLLFLDSDDLWPDDMLAGLRAVLADDPAADWLIGDHRELTPEGKLTEPVHQWAKISNITDKNYPKQVSNIKKIGGMAVWQYCLRRRMVIESGVRFSPELRWAEDTLFTLLLLHCRPTVWQIPTVLVVYRCNRPGSLANSNLPGHLAGAVAVWQELRRVLPAGPDREAGRAVAADIFWPAARAAAVRDAALRRACVPAVDQARELYSAGSQCRGRIDWVLFRWLLTVCRARLGLWLASRIGH